MDLSEGIFGLFSNWLRKQKKSQFMEHSILFDEFHEACLFVGHFVHPDIVRAVESQDFGIRDGILYLPKQLHLSKNKALNFEILFQGVILSAVAHSLDIKYSKSASDYDRLVEFSFSLNKLYQLSIDLFPQFLKARRKLLSAILENGHFQDSYSRRLVESLFDHLTVCEKSKQVWMPPVLEEGSKRRAIEKEIFILTGVLSSAEIIGKNPFEVPGIGGTKEKSRQKKADRRKIKNLVREQVNLQEESKKDNPVMHSFEKLETADDYQGGFRQLDDASTDELNSEALDEVNFRSVTRSSQSSSLSHADSDGGLGLNSIDIADLPVEETKEIYFYPEWNFKKQSYQAKHCRLISEDILADSSARNAWQEDVLFDASKVEQLRQTILQFFNQPQWTDRLTDGEEISLTQFCDYQALKLAKVETEPRLYQTRVRKARQLELLIILDNSMSSESYVNGKRVLDIAKGTLQLFRECYEGLEESVSIAICHSKTRNHCVYQNIKRRTESWMEVKRRIDQIKAEGYTRLGPAIRHGISVLNEGGQKNKAIFLISDAKPTDYDGYEGQYGILDIQKARLECEKAGIYLHCFAIDQGGTQHLESMFRNWDKLLNPDELPDLMSRVYLKLMR